MSPDLPAALPASMIDAAVTAYTWHTTRVLYEIDSLAPVSWECACGEGGDEGLMASEHVARAVLAAALAEWEVHEQFRAAFRDRPDDDRATPWLPERADPDAWMAFYGDRARPAAYVVERRYSITTQPEPVASPVDTPREDPVEVSTDPAKWRVIDTDTEQPSGVAPVCPRPDVHAMMHGGPPADTAVYDECCTGPHIECWSPAYAKVVLQALNETGAEVCS